MARIFCQTLARQQQQSLTCRLSTFRCKSNKPSKSASLLELDLDPKENSGSDKVEIIATTKKNSGSGSGSGSGSDKVEVFGKRMLEDALHGIMVKRSAPDWLPMVPGSSYWVPPRKKMFGGLVELVGIVDRGSVGEVVVEEGRSEFMTSRGWPSMSYFVGGEEPHSASKPKKTESEFDDDDET